VQTAKVWPLVRGNVWKRTTMLAAGDGSTR
jgi:hypothetical protein